MVACVYRRELEKREPGLQDSLIRRHDAGNLLRNRPTVGLLACEINVQSLNLLPRVRHCPFLLAP